MTKNKVRWGWTSNGPKGVPTFELPNFWKAKQVGSAYVIGDGIGDGGTTIVVTTMGRQDLRVAWSVTVVERDGDTRSVTGLSKRSKVPDKKINNALRKLCKRCFDVSVLPQPLDNVADVNEDRLGRAPMDTVHGFHG